MKTFAALLVLTLSASSFANSFSCVTTTDMTNTKRLINVSEKSIDIEGLESLPVLEVLRADIDGPALKKCAKKAAQAQYKCLNKLVPKAKDGDSKMSMHNLLVQVADLEPDPKGSVGMVSSMDIATKADINLSEIASGVVYVTKFGTYYPNNGVYEFFNARGESLGRFFLDAFARNCRDLK